MAAPIDEKWQHPDMEVRVRLRVQSEDDEGNVQFAMAFEVLGKGGGRIDPFDLSVKQLSLLGIATKQLYALLEQSAQAITESEDFAASAGLKIR